MNREWVEGKEVLIRSRTLTSAVRETEEGMGSSKLPWAGAGPEKEETKLYKDRAFFDWYFFFLFDWKGGRLGML